MEDQQFILRWHYHETTLLRNLPQLLEAEILTDITISADNQLVKAHRIILASCSPYFLQLFQNMGALQHPVIILHNTNYEELKSLITFIYRGQCLITKKQLPGLLSLAKMLQIQGLCDMKVPFELLNKDVLTKQMHSRDEKIKIRNIVDEEVMKNREEKDNFPVIEREQVKSDHDGGGLDASTSKKSKELLVHMETHEEGCYMCQSCPHVSRSRDALRKHVSYRHQEQYNIKKRRK
ncbi:hypothetical protein RN001_014075 [Aquatica leii]|uniref:BTB domain-containing protein n=1 Tax=Aquatica leii TaxID=1421715 RepID=A0AAN7Q0F1_9COLE|nr:hypothetical protein RN001_014075 [Aquatica leii]